LYQSTTMTWPSGLIDGMSRRTTSFSQESRAGSRVVATSWANSIAIWVEPTSVEWIVQVTRAMVFPSATRARACSSERPSGLARRPAISR
jgi:hypothetical protein